MDRYKAHWRSLATREQQLLIFAVLVLLLGIFYWGIWAPISDAETNAQKRLLAEENTLNYVKQTANKIISYRQNGTAQRPGGSISSIITNTAAKYSIEITRMQPQGNKIQLWMDDIPFNALLNYLNDLVKQQGLSLNSIDIKKSELSGYVQVRRIQLSQ